MFRLYELFERYQNLLYELFERYQNLLRIAPSIDVQKMNQTKSRKSGASLAN